MMFTKLCCIAAFGVLLLAISCNSVSRQQLEKIKPGDVLVYRYQKEGKSWFYAHQVTRVEGNKVYYHPGENEATSGNDYSITIFDKKREQSIPKEELLKFENEQGDEKRVIIWIK